MRLETPFNPPALAKRQWLQQNGPAAWWPDRADSFGRPGRSYVLDSRLRRVEDANVGVLGVKAVRCNAEMVRRRPMPLPLRATLRCRSLPAAL